MDSSTAVLPTWSSEVLAKKSGKKLCKLSLDLCAVAEVLLTYILLTSNFDLYYRKKAGVELAGGSYLIHKVYDDSETLSLVVTACEVLGKWPIGMLHASCMLHARMQRGIHMEVSI